ncbi:MAG: peptidase [Erysipelotrichaceae bacterium]|nr:peptidase [Erysipelotrichaceae bacterium]
MNFKVNDLVTRKSYNNDVVFKIVFISDRYVILQGVNIRLCADCFLDDLNPYELRDFNDVSYDLPIIKGNYLNGKILHLDSDIDYLKRSMKLYEHYKVPSVGYKINEKDMPNKIDDLLNKHHPDILVVTGHDAIDKKGHNVNSSFFVECVKKARIYQPCKDTLCIIAGACYSSFKDLIYEGSNISSSPGKVSINVLDPSKAAVMVATTPVNEYVDMEKIINITSNKSKGMGGIDTKGLARKIYS